MRRVLAVALAALAARLLAIAVALSAPPGPGRERRAREARWAAVRRTPVWRELERSARDR